MKYMSELVNGKSILISGFDLLSANEMLNIRGGSEPEKPKSRPRDVLDWEEAAALKQSTDSTEEVSILTYLISWLKKW